MPIRTAGIVRASSKLGINVRGVNGIPALQLRRINSGKSLSRRTILVNTLPLEVLIRIFSFCESPRTFSAVCRIFLRIAKDPHARAKWFITRYGAHMAFYHSLRSHRLAFNPEVGKFMLARGAGMPRFVIQYVVREYHQRRNSFGTTNVVGGGAQPGQGAAAVAPGGPPGAVGTEVGVGTNAYGETNVRNRSYVSTATYAFFVTHGYKLYDTDADFKEDDSVRFERLLFGSTASGDSSQVLETLRNLIVKFKFVPMKGTGTPLDETVYSLSKLDLSLVDHLFANGLEYTDELNDLVIERVLWRTDVTEASLQAYLKHGFKLTSSAIKKGLQIARPATLTALRVHVPHMKLQKLAEDTVVDMMGPMGRGWTFTSEAVDFLRQSFPISDDVIERALFVRPPSVYAAAVALSLANGSTPPEKNIHEFPATRCYFKSSPCQVWRWVLRAYGPRHPFTLACFDDALSRAAGDRDLHALHDIFLDAGVRFRPRHIKILACRVLHRDMASNAFHLMKVLRAQLTSHFRDSPTIMQQANFTSTLSRKAMNDPLFSPTSFVSSQPLPAPYQQYYQYPEDADEFGDLNEWVRLIREEIVENREWIERMRTTQLEGGPRGGVYRVSRPPEEGLKFLDEARELLNELSVVLQNQGSSTPSILQSMMGQGLRSRKFTDALGVVRRASTGNFKDGGSGTYGSPGSSGIHTRPSGNGKGSSIVSPSQSTTATFTFAVPVAAAFNQVGILPTINTGSEDEVESQLDMLSEGLDSENVSSWGNDRLMRVVAPMSSSTTARNEGENFASILTDISEREENENSTFDEAAVFPFEGFQIRAISFPELGDSLALETPEDAVRPSANVFLGGESEGRSGGRNDESSWIGSALARLFRLQRQL